MHFPNNNKRLVHLWLDVMCYVSAAIINY